MSAALTRYANPAATIGHAGPCAPIHSDERIAIADLPRFADAPLPNVQSPRAALLQRDREQMERANRLLRESLADVLKLAGRAARTPADDAVIERATRVLELGGLL